MIHEITAQRCKSLKNFFFRKQNVEVYIEFVFAGLVYNLVAFHICPVQPISSLNGTYELVLARTALLVDHSRPLLPLRSAEARKIRRVVVGKMNARAWTFPFKLCKKKFSVGQNGQTESDLLNQQIISFHFGK